jgi:RimJ/RimL family protein N-acetyltransferase
VKHLGVRLRPARWYDKWYVMRLLNSPDVVAKGGGTIAPSWWWTSVRPHMSIVVWCGATAGYIIVRPSDGEVSIVLHPFYRGLGIGTEALRELRLTHLHLTARVQADNEASLRAFQKAGFAVEQRSHRETLFRSAR